MREARCARVSRKTRETSIEVAVALEARDAPTTIETGIAFYDHMLDALAKHGGFALEISCEGDLQVDDHHSVEDTALALGECFDAALADRAGITRFGYAYAPLDEALVRAVVDISGRPFAHVDIPLKRERIGAMACENVPHFFRSFASSLRATLHLDVVRGENEHHIVEASFKAFALAMRQAVALRDPSASDVIPSTKGVL